MDPFTVAVALARYTYNVDAVTRAKALYEHFGGDCADPQDLVRVCMTDKMYIATELAPPTGAAYVNHALEAYANEAAQYVHLNRIGSERIWPAPWGGEDKIARSVAEASEKVETMLRELERKVSAADDGDSIYLKLKKESWENIFRVLKWCAPMELTVCEDAYVGATGEHWSLGNFWAAIHELQRQFGEEEGGVSESAVDGGGGADPGGTDGGAG